MHLQGAIGFARDADENVSPRTATSVIRLSLVGFRIDRPDDSADSNRQQLGQKRHWKIMGIRKQFFTTGRMTDSTKTHQSNTEFRTV